MKRIILTVLALALPAVVFAIDANRLTYVQLLAPSASQSQTSAAVDIAAYKGNAAFIVMFEGSSLLSTGTVALTHCTTSGGTYLAATNLAGTVCEVSQVGPLTNALTSIPIDLSRLDRYVKVTVTQSGITNKVAALLAVPMTSN